MSVWYNYYGTPRLSQNIVICQCLATVSPSSKCENRRASALLRNILACEQALCLGKNSKEREGKGGKGGREAFSLFPLPTPLNQRPVHRLVTFKIQGFVWEKTYLSCNLRKWKDFNKKNSLRYSKCVLRLSCVVQGPIYGRFIGFMRTVFSLYKHKTHKTPINRPLDHTGET